jgi:hypothetical protein
MFDKVLREGKRREKKGQKIKIVERLICGLKS